MNQLVSPFKFLDSYQEEDIEVFFGREAETEEMYDALSGVKHLLVYGPSGVGKTSLVECGLRNQFSDADWYALTIRRGNNILASAFNEINQALVEKFEVDPKTNLPLEEGLTIYQIVENLFTERYQPIYLIFDQFEELVISNNQEEKDQFFNHLNQLIRYKVPCRVLLIIREEFIGHLSEFESICPSIFQHRFRLEKMRVLDVKKVILNMLEAPRYREYFSVENSDLLAANILAKLPDQLQEIELAHVQVFLSELWERANKGTKQDNLPHLHPGIIRDSDSLTGVLDSFLKKQLEEMETLYGERVCLEVLAKMISERHTKLQLSKNELQQELQSEGVVSISSLTELLNDLASRRIIRPLRSGDRTLYEISHDLLALVVGQNLTEEMKMRERATEVYRVYQDRKGNLSQEALDYLRMFEKYIEYPVALKKLIKESKYELESQRNEELRKTEKRLKLALALLAVVVLAMVAAFYFKYQADQQKVAADEATVSAQESLVTAYKAQINRNRREKEITQSNVESLKLYKAGDTVIQIETNKIDSLSLLIDSLELEIKSFGQ